MTFVQALYSMDAEIRTLEVMIANNSEPTTVKMLTNMRLALVRMKSILIEQANEMQKAEAIA